MRATEGGRAATLPGGRRRRRVAPVVARAARKGILLVSDRDGTMVGGDAEADASTAAFREYWLSNEHSERGSCLAYSTGRTIGQYLELRNEKASLAEPDVLICAVGTRVYERREGGDWVENEGWRAKLDERWCGDEAMRAAKGAITLLGEDNAHLRPESELNSHKITVGVRDHLVSQAKAEKLDLDELEDVGEVL